MLESKMKALESEAFQKSGPKTQQELLRSQLSALKLRTWIQFGSWVEEVSDAIDSMKSGKVWWGRWPAYRYL